MSFTDQQKADLAAPLNAANVKSREQAGRKLSYIEAWHAIAEANRIFGFDGWTRETVDLRQLVEREHDGKFRVAYSAKVKVCVGEIVREGCGYGSGIDKDLGQAHESALKEAESDAMKRALMTFGNPFGLALYDKTQANVDDGPMRSPGMVKAAIEAISNLDTMEAHAAWQADNRPVILAMQSDDADEVVRAWKARAVTIKVMADASRTPAVPQANGHAQEVFS